MQYLTIDGIEYRVRTVYGSLQRTFTVVEGSNSGKAITGRTIRDILGTEYSYTLSVEPDPRFPEDYDAFYDLISTPRVSHRVVMPYGQTTLEFDAAFESGTDKMGATIGGITRWNGLSVTFRPIRPQLEV